MQEYNDIIAEGGLNAEGITEYKNKLKESESLLQTIDNVVKGLANEQEDVTAAMRQSNFELKEVKKSYDSIEKVAGKTIKELSQIDVPLRESTITRFGKFVGATARSFRSVISETFDKAGKTLLQAGENLRERLNPKNIIRRRVAEFRERRAERTENNRGTNRFVSALGSLGKKFAIFGSLALLLGSFIGQLKPVEDAMAVVGDVVKKLAAAVAPLADKLIRILLPAILDVFAALLPLLALLINIALPPVVMALGLVVTIVGNLIKGIALLVKEMLLIPVRLDNLFAIGRSRAKKDEKVREATAALNQNKIYKTIVGSIENA